MLPGISKYIQPILVTRGDRASSCQTKPLQKDIQKEGWCLTGQLVASRHSSMACPRIDTHCFCLDLCQHDKAAARAPPTASKGILLAAQSAAPMLFGTNRSFSSPLEDCLFLYKCWLGPASQGSVHPANTRSAFSSIIQRCTIVVLG